MWSKKIHKRNRKKGGRLLTEEERKVILDGYESMKDKSRLISAMAIIAIVYIILIALWGIKGGLICITIASVLLLYHFLTLRYVVKKVRANEMYASEATFISAGGKGSLVCLKGYKSEYSCKNMLLREPMEKGDRVIVLEVPGQAWVYRARRKNIEKKQSL